MLEHLLIYPDRHGVATYFNSTAPRSDVVSSQKIISIHTKDRGNEGRTSAYLVVVPRVLFASLARQIQLLLRVVIGQEFLQHGIGPIEEIAGHLVVLRLLVLHVLHAISA